MSTSPKYVDRRDRVMVGNLPDDFLRVDTPADASSSVDGASSAVQNQQQQTAARQNFVTQITICLVEAQLVKNYSITKMDPYVRVRIGHSVFETHSSMRGGKNPSWNKNITSYLPSGIKTIHIEIFDEKTLTPDERIAYADYVLTDEALSGKFIDTWVLLSGKQGVDKEGSINITLCVRSVPYWYPSMQPAAPIMVVQQPPAIGFMPYCVPDMRAMGQPITVQYPVGPQPLPYGYAPPPVQPQPRYTPTEDDVKQIQEVFPSFDKDVIVNVLENTCGNKDQAISSLLSMS